jgi:hypothetical protein
MIFCSKKRSFVPRRLFVKPIDLALNLQNLVVKHKDLLMNFVRRTGQDLSRSRKQDVVDVVGQLLHFNLDHHRNGYAINSQNYFFTFFGHSQRAVSRSSFCEARSKLKWQALRALLFKTREQAAPFLDQRDLWHNYRILGVDTSELRLPASRSILKQFPRRAHPQHRTHFPMARWTVLADVRRRMPIDGYLQNDRGSERKALLKLCCHCGEGDLLLLDRGFEGQEIFAALQSRGLHFVGRIRAVSKWVNDFLRSGATSQVVELVTKKHPTVKLRIVRGPQSRGDKPLLIVTNLIEPDITAKELIKLYRERWEVETLFSSMKTQLKVEEFHARSPHGIRQELWANLVVLAMASILLRSITRPHLLKRINGKSLLEALRREVWLWIRSPHSKAFTERRLRALLLEITKLTCHHQPGRRNPRINKRSGSPWIRERTQRLREFQKSLKQRSAA